MLEPPFGLRRMIGYIFAIVSVATAAWASASPPLRSFVIKETHNAPLEWRQLEDDVPDQVLRLRIGLKSENFNILESHLLKSSDPSHEMYGAHLSWEEVNMLVAPSKEALGTVHGWLIENGIDESELEYSPAKDWIMVDLPIRKVEQMLDTKYSIFKHVSTGDQLVRALTWSLPLYLHEHIEVIQPTNSFFRPTSYIRSVKTSFSVPQRMSTGDHSICKESFVTPGCLRTFYRTIDYEVKAPSKNRMGLSNFNDNVSNRSDTFLFLKQFRPEAVEAAFNFKTEIINNGSDNQGPINEDQREKGLDKEADLDAETMLGIAWPTPLETFNTGKDVDPFGAWLMTLLNEKDLPSVISTSYSVKEKDNPSSAMKKLCEMFAQLGARGTSVIFPSGDNGVGIPKECHSNDPKHTPTFVPEFPASCPWVTTVGATRNFDPEIVAFDDGTLNPFSSGGGFSQIFPRPSYQNKAVSAYVDSLGYTHEGLYNPNGRGYPDVAAQGYHYAYVWNGETKVVDGTSASAPCFAAIVALLNDARLAARLPTLGFLNPFIYGNGSTGLNDIEYGSTRGCGGVGFPATKGWDAATGFGTPDFQRLLSLVTKGKSQ